MSINAKIRRDLIGCHPAVRAIAEAKTLEKLEEAFDGLQQFFAENCEDEEADWESGAEAAVLSQTGVSIDQLRETFRD